MKTVVVRITDLAEPGRTATLAATRERAERLAWELVGIFWPRFLIEIDPPLVRCPFSVVRR